MGRKDKAAFTLVLFSLSLFYSVSLNFSVFRPLSLFGHWVLPCHSSDSSPHNSNGAEILFVIRYGNSTVISQMMLRHADQITRRQTEPPWKEKRQRSLLTFWFYCTFWINPKPITPQLSCISSYIRQHYFKTWEPFVSHLWLQSRLPAPNREWRATC